MVRNVEKRTRKKYTDVAKCLHCGYEWNANFYGQPKPSRCPHCKGRTVIWKKNATEKQLNAHMPEDLAPEKPPEKVETVMEKTAEDTEPEKTEIKPETVPEKTETEQITVMEKVVEKPLETVSQPEPIEKSVEKVEKETKIMAQKKEHPEKKTYRKRTQEYEEPPEDDYDVFSDFPYDAENEAWAEAKRNTPKVNPMGLVFVIGAVVVAGAAVYFLRKSGKFLPGKSSVPAAQAPVQQNTARPRLRPETLSRPRLGGML